MDTLETANAEKQSVICDFRYILKSSRQACQHGKLFLATAGLVLTFLWGFGLDWMWIAAGGGIAAEDLRSSPLIIKREQILDGESNGVATSFLRHTKHCLDQSLKATRKLQLTGGMGDISRQLHDQGGSSLMPLAGQGYGLLAFIRAMQPAAFWILQNHWFYTLLFGIVSLIIWSLLGGGICRISALQFTRDEGVTVREALSFSSRKLRDLALAPAIPVIAVLVIGIVLLVGGWVMRLWFFGPLIGGLLFWLALVAGAIIAVFVIGTVVGFALMWPTIAVEGLDCTDAIGRSFSYLWERPERSVLYGLWAIFYGAVVWLVVRLFAVVLLYAVHGFVSKGLPQLDYMWETPSYDVMYRQPELPAPPASAASDTAGESEISAVEGNANAGAQAPPAGRPPATVLSWDDRYIGRPLVGMWVGLFSFLVYGYLISYFFTGSTIVYTLLRFHVDDTELDDVYLEQATQPAPEMESPPPQEDSGGAAGETGAANQGGDAGQQTGNAGTDETSDAGDDHPGAKD